MKNKNDFLLDNLHKTIIITMTEENNRVKELGEKIGYGNMMYLASELWKKDMIDCGYPTSGVFVPALPADVNEITELGEGIIEYKGVIYYNRLPETKEPKKRTSTKLTIQSSSDKLHLERVLSCISMSIETEGWPSFILNSEDIQTLIDYLDTQLIIIKTK
jgi:hypothetical protein